MKILAIETSAGACSIAVSNGSHIDAIHTIGAQQPSRQILVTIESLLNRNNIELNQLNAIAFGCGPGSFTGVRIAASVTQGLAFAYQFPVIKISSLAVLAQTAFSERGWRNLLIAVDAHSREIYFSNYLINENNQLEINIKELVCHPENVPISENDQAYGVGDGWQKYHDELIRRLSFSPVEVDTTLTPKATALLTLAQIKYEKKEWVSAADALPVYLRDIEF